MARTPRTSRAHWLLAMVAAFALLAVACGSSKGEASSSTLSLIHI